jgi:AcrR family transcriptional regulator
MKPSLKERKQQSQRETILDAAGDLLTERGYASVKLEEIADRACLSKPTLYLHFKSKEDIIIHLTLRNFRQAQQIIDGLDKAQPAVDQLTEFYKWAIEHRFATDRQLNTNLTQNIFPIAYENADLLNAESQIVLSIERIVDRCKAEGSVRSDIDTTFIVQLLVSVFYNYGIDRLIQQGKLSPSLLLESFMQIILVPKG